MPTLMLDGSRIVSESWDNILIIYLYDESGSPVGMQYRTSSMAEGIFYTFYFEKNLQGDIVAVYTESGVKVVGYTYDAWGNFTTTYYSTVGTNWYALNNPFRYRGYYYDTETGLYYLQSRYYNPQWGRFISADGYEVILATLDGLTDKNLYSYCDNNPINRIDQDGEFWHLVIGAAAGAVVGVACALISGETDPAVLAVAAGAGLLSGLLIASGAGAVAQIAGGAVISGAESYLSQGIKNGFDNVDYSEVVFSTVAGGVSAVGAGIDKGLSKHLMTAGKQATKRVANKLSHQGLRAAGKELSSAATYYFANTVELFYKPLIKESTNELFKAARESLIQNVFIISAS